MTAKPTVGQPDKSLRDEAKHLRLKKRFSQNFLVDPTVVDRIVDVVSPEKHDTLLEIGPGAGFLTQALLKKSNRLVAVEVERKMCRYLNDKFSPALQSGVLKLIEQDFLKFEPNQLDADKFAVVGNLPYSISTPILFHLCGELSEASHLFRERVSQMTLMVQKEVGQRIAAQPGTKAYNHLSVAVQYWFNAELNFLVPPQSFYPAPKVTSSVITLKPLGKPRVPVIDLPLFARVVRQSFQYKRKTLRNALMLNHFVCADVLDTILPQVGIDPMTRAERVSIETFGALADAIHQSTRQN